MELGANGKNPQDKVSLVSLAAALVMGFIALGSEPWWTLDGATSNQILQIRVSPFYALLDGIGLPATIPSSALIGAVARLLLVNSSILLGLSAVRPNAWWRKIAEWFSLSSLTGVFLSFTLLMHASRASLLTTYGSEVPVFGTQTLYGSILGLDLAYYANPPLTASFTFAFFLGIISFAMVGGTQLARAIRNPEQHIIGQELTKGAREVHLNPPYQQVWLSSGDQELNPLGRDPDRLTDDQLAVSFEKLNKTLQPGGIVKIIVPAWAANLGDRLTRLVPWAGFKVEKSEIIYRESGRPEQELLFRKPMVVGGQTLEVELQQPPDEVIQPTVPPVPDTNTEPGWTEPMTKQERTILKMAVSAITRNKQPIPYRELINDVYMELLDRKMEFESARQIEYLLLKHTGRELAIIEELDETGTRVAKKWWLGDQGIEQGSEGSGKHQFPRVGSFLQKLRRPPQSNYKPKKQRDDD